MELDQHLTLPTWGSRRSTAVQQQKEGTMQHLTMRVAGVIGVLVVTVAVLSSCAGHVYAVVGQAMEPNFVEGQTITAIPFDPAQLQRGDPVIYQLDNGDIHFKRVVGLPGESIQIVGGRVYIDGVTLAEPYLSAGPMMDDSPMTQGVASPVSPAIPARDGPRRPERRWYWRRAFRDRCRAPRVRAH